MVHLCLIPLVAAGTARILARLQESRRYFWGAILIVFVSLETALVSPFPVRDAQIPEPIVEMAAAKGDGAVLVIPNIYAPVHMLHQTVHGRPITGGWAARWNPERHRRFRDWYLSHIKFRSRRELQQAGIAFVVVDRKALERLGGADPWRQVSAGLQRVFPMGAWRRDPAWAIYRVGSTLEVMRSPKGSGRTIDDTKKPRSDFPLLKSGPGGNRSDQRSEPGPEAP